MNEYGNINSKFINLYYLVNDEGELLSHPYYCIIKLGNDHYAVASLTDLSSTIDHNHFELAQTRENIKARINWAIMRVNRDENGRVIRGSETLVTHFVYDRIEKNNLNTAFVQCNNKCTYIELDESSKNYGEQLLPCV